MSKLRKHFENNIGFYIILLLGFFLRIYKPLELFYYGHDQDLAGWFVKDVVIDKHLRLIGQETSTQGIFIGPLYYYLLIPFYVLFGMDPVGGVVMITMLGIFSIWSIYFVFKKIFGEKQALVAAFIYAVSFYTVFNDRDVVPTTPVITWTIWYFYGLNLLMKGKQQASCIILGLLIGLIWHLNFALVLLLPLIPLSVYLSHNKVKLQSVLNGLLILLLTSTPLILFELRHNFSQTKALIVSLTTNQHAIVTGYERFARTMHLFSKNIDGLIWGSVEPFSYEITSLLLLVVAMVLIHKKLIKKELSIIIGGWLVAFITFFSVYSKNLSEYYLNGTIIIPVILIALAVSYYFSKKQTRIYGYIILALFLIFNLHRFFTIPVNKSGYLFKKAVVGEIENNSKEHNYPCISISYITKPGYEFGYRFFFFLENMHVNRPDSGSPVYTIVYPLRGDIEVDITFGHIGLIYPDYSRYTTEKVVESCSGDNSNLTDSMWGFVN